MTATPWTWVSPNGVRHAVDAGGHCLTCGRAHSPVVYQASDNGAGEVTVSPALYLGKDLPPEAADRQALQADAAPADAVLSEAGWERTGCWARGGFTWNARVQPTAGTTFPPGPDFIVHLPLAGAGGPLVTRWYLDSAGERHAAEVTYPDGSRCHVRLKDKSLSGADPQVWDSSNRERYQLTDYYCPGHGGAVCQYGACDQVRYTGPLTESDTDGAR